MINKDKLSDDDDLIGLIKILWQGKRWIIASAIIFLIIGVCYIKMSQPKWTSQAVITGVLSSSPIKIREKLFEIYPIFNDYENKTNKLGTLLNSNNLITSFISTYNDMKTKKDFIDQVEIKRFYYKGIDDLTKNELKNKIYTKESNKNPLEYTLYYSYKNDADSQKLLNKYMDFVSKKTSINVIYNIENILNETKLKLNIKLGILNEKAFNTIKNIIKETQYSLDIAKAANISSPLIGYENDLFSINLGFKGLAEKLKILKSMKDYDIFYPEISLIKNRIHTLDLISFNKVEDFHNVNILEAASYPIYKDSPKEKLLVVMSLFIGLMFGAGVIIIRSFFVRND